ncbi:hypothetical protein L228DRAFT_257662 [Xylona heveae TC161]|uniref:BRCT domain-containing protein n=1 Tax=Xylona heveae (strain CBS 132557 / TC161) TaxID=1328760 RepID=A0A165JFY6_XYLHT|nr:hypothetical protein L228DRAFT_257662 [Xylona heveae TC161]KZF26183.1 hypothetical protein L228DRAFT_257662 [Xylona heveae TC161]
MVVSTRARAAENTRPETRSTKITTPAAKARRTTKRKAVEEEHDAAEDTARGTNLESSKATRGRSKRTAANNGSKHEETDAHAEATETPAPKPGRGRPRKGTTSSQSTDFPEGSKKTTTRRGKLSDEPKKNVTRITKSAEGSRPAETIEDVGERDTVRVNAGRMITSAIKGASGALAAAPKKKVTFQTEPIAIGDKENQAPLQARTKAASSSGAEEKSSAKATGLKAKPMRRPAAKTTKSNNKKHNATTEEPTSTKEREAKSPLSPKKAKQIAVAKQNTSDEEEPKGKHETPVKELNKSPVKGLGNAVPSSTKKDIYTLEAPVPQKTNLSAPQLLGKMDTSYSALNSPARRPPPSPYKDALKNTPVKFTLEQPVSKAHFKAATPKPAKASLLQSPARRPSPVKGAPATAPTKGYMARPAMEPPQTISSMRFPNRSLYTPSRLGRSPLRPPRSPVHVDETETMTMNENAATENRPTKVISSEPVIEQVESPDIVMDDSPTRATFQNELLQTPSRLSTVIELPSMIDAAASPEQLAVEEENQHQFKRSTTPPGPPPRSITQNFGSLTPATVYPSDESESEDELQSHRRGYSPKQKFEPIATPLVHAPASPSPFTAGKTPKSVTARGKQRKQKPISHQDQLPGMTPLVQQFSTWQGASPDKRASKQKERKGQGIFSAPILEKPTPKLQKAVSPLVPSPSTMNLTPMQQSFFSDEMNAREEEDFLMMDAEAKENEMNNDLHLALPLDTPAHTFADGQQSPIDPMILESTDRQAAGLGDTTITCTPAKLVAETPRVVHTVTKVPLKPAADDEESPSRLPLRLNNGPRRSPRKSLQNPFSSKDDTLRLNKPMNNDNFTYETPTKQTPSTPMISTGGVDWQKFATPAKTPRPDLNPTALRGVIAYVDVHTTEGADASGIFIELLTQMGARCVKQWNWNPFAGSGELSSSTGSTTDEDQPVGMSKSKIGITHLVYKDGGKRTLEKVREAKGQVQCVGVGWVLDCERDNKWLDEIDYAVDITMLPRGGQRRRKSMEPRALSNVNGNLVLTSTSHSAKQQSNTEAMSPTKEFLNLDSPVLTSGAGANNTAPSRRVSFAALPTHQNRRDSQVFSPAISDDDEDDDDDDDYCETPVAFNKPSSTPPQPPMTPSAAAETNKENINLSAPVPVPASSPETPYTPFTYTFETMSDIDDDDDDDNDDNESNNRSETAYESSPDMHGTSPYYLKASSLVQQTCPPKKSARPSFFAPVSKDAGPQNESVRQKLLMARRKSLQWAPKVGSPLARGVVNYADY